MKNAINILLAATLVFAAADAALAGELSKRTVTLEVDISETKVKFSRADYSTAVVKILVPALADVTILDHRNTGEGAPCLAAYDAQTPADVIQGNPAVEQANFDITLSKDVYLSADNQCYVTLVETVEGFIRGFKFEHVRTHHVGIRHQDDCR